MTARARDRRTAGVVGLPLLLGALTSCGAPETADAEAAARAYLDAIAAGDLETVEEMAAPQALADATDGGTDITGALPSVAEPITDVWVSVLGPEPVGEGVEPRSFEVMTTYVLGDRVGGGLLTLTLPDGADAGDPTQWVVEWPLIADRFTYVHDATVGGVDVTGDSDGEVTLLGYPGGYEVVAEDGEPEVVYLGVD